MSDSHFICDNYVHFKTIRISFLSFQTDCKLSYFASRCFVMIKVIPKVKQMNNWLRISWCNSLSHFKLQVVDSLTFQAKYWNKSSLFFLRILFYPIKTWFGHQNKFLFHLKKWLFPNHPYLTTKSDFYQLDLVYW